jgi:hypothetical protein
MLFIETPIFTREIAKLLADHEYGLLQRELVLRPEAGKLIQRGGGLRKIRWKVPGSGKRGGIRVIYFYDSADTIYMLYPYKKNVQDDLSARQLKQLRELVKEWLQ